MEKARQLRAIVRQQAHALPKEGPRAMRAAICLLCVLAGAIPAFAQTTALQDSLLDRLVGDWVLTGTIAGSPTTHDVRFEWILGHEYVRMHEVSRERTPDGAPAYEADVTIGWDPSSSRYTCLWLDNTGSTGLIPQAMAFGVAAGDSLAFLFRGPDGSVFHTTFLYARSADTWSWHMDGEEGGVSVPFARVTLQRKP